MLLIQKNKNIIITTLFICCCLAVYGYFPVKGNLQKTITALTFFMLLPILYNKLILKRGISTLRLHIGHWKKGLILMLISLLLGCLIMIGLAKYSNFLTGYSMPLGLAGSFGYFVFYELVLVAFFTALYEFFFRGFVMFNFVPFFKKGAVIGQAVLFLLFLLLTSGLSWEFAPYLVFAPFAGWIAYKSDSLLYSFIGQLIFIIIIDASIIKLVV
jgi:membrane protease YdiL (CAAX protease family)